MHGACDVAGDRVVKTLATVTVRVTVLREQSGGSHDGAKSLPRGELQSGWKHGVWVKGAQGVRELEWQLHEPCGGPHLAEPRVER